MTFKHKSWVWWFTFPVAHNNYTTLRHTIYCPRKSSLPPPTPIIQHERIHEWQQEQVGFFRFVFLYIFMLPFFWNPWRFSWEYDAYTLGSKISPEEALKELRSFRYGWLILNRRKK